MESSFVVECMPASTRGWNSSTLGSFRGHVHLRSVHCRHGQHCDGSNALSMCNPTNRALRSCSSHTVIPFEQVLETRLRIPSVRPSYNNRYILLSSTGVVPLVGREDDAGSRSAALQSVISRPCRMTMWLCCMPRFQFDHA